MARGSRSDKDKGGRRGRGARPRLWPYVIAVGVAAATVAVLIAVAVLSGGDDEGGGGGPVVLPSPGATGIAREGHVLGSADAPVTILEYADFQ